MKSAWADTIIASSAVSAIWHKGPLTQTSQCDAPGKPTCYTFTGSHAVTVTSADTELSLVPSRYVVYPGKASVTFTGSALPSMWGRHSMPFNTERWTWTRDSAGTPTQHCANQATCAITPQTSGTMTLTALVNGVEKSRSVHIRVLCGPTGNPLLDSLPILDALSDAWSSSNAESPNLHDRRERGGYVFSDSLGGSPYVPCPAPTDGPCRAPLTPVNPIPGTPVAGYHTHPFSHRDSLPPNCRPPENPYPPGTYGRYDADRYGGPSAQDIDRVANDGIPQFILDKDYLYVVPLGTTRQNAEQTVQRIPRVSATGCRLLWEIIMSSAHGYSINATFASLILTGCAMAVPIPAFSQNYDCLPATSADAQLLRSYMVQLVTATDSSATLTREMYKLPAGTADDVDFVTDSATCNAAGVAYYSVVYTASPLPSSRALSVIKVGPNRYVVEDVDEHAGEFGITIVMDSSFSRLAIIHS